MATIIERQTERGAKRLYVVFRAIDRETKTRRKVWTLVPSGLRKEATGLRAEIEVGLRRNGGYWPLEAPKEEQEPTTFRAYAYQWLENRARHRVSERVYLDYRRTITNFLAPAFGDMELAEIRRRHVNDFVAGLAAEGRARNSIRYTVAPLRAMLNDAMDDELIPANPAARVAIPAGAPVRKARIPTSEELDKILEAADEDGRDVISVVASLGLRRGEAFALRWQDVDVREGIVNVRGTNHRGRIADRTKTRAGMRLVPLFESARKVLVSRKLRLSPDLTTEESFVFANAIGGAMDPGNWYRREWTPTLEKVGLVDVINDKPRPRFHFHELRHYAATRLDELGMSAKLRTEIVGHANEEITNSVYTHVSRERVAAAAKEFDPLAVAR